MQKSTLGLLSLVLLSSCSNLGRHLASSDVNPPPLENLKEASEMILRDVGHPSFPEYCTSYLKELETRIDQLDLKSLDLRVIKDEAEVISESSWKIRSTLHSRLPEFDQACAHQVLSTFRQFRFVEDYLGELSKQVVHMSPAEVDFQNQPIPIKSESSFYQFRANGPVQFQPGDLLITRGVSFLSGMIARMGQRATQFSHVVMVTENPETKKLETIESYVGVGVAFYDFDYALKNENARILWLRAKDRSLGKKASELMGELVRNRLAEKRPIKYDYELNFADPKRMSCAEVSQVAFQMASENEFKIPYYPNEISGAKSIIERLKLVEGETYEPGDMEIDPRFELMGEFQDLRLTRDSRQKDAVMTAMFDWMENKNYELKDNFESRMAGSVIHAVRKTFLWPLVKKMLKLDDFSKEIPRNMLRTLSIVNDLGAAMLAELKLRDEAFEKKYGVPMSYMDFYRALEEMRKEDLEVYQNKKTRKNSKFHKLIRPRGK